MQLKLSASVLSLAAASLLAFPIASSAAKSNQYMNYKGEAPCPAVKYLHDGFYAGVGLGYDSYSTHVSRSFTFGGVTNSASTNESATGWLGSLFAGYGQYFNDMYYLGGEVFIDTSDAQRSGSFSTTAGGGASYTNKFTANTGYGISLLPGYKLNDSTLLYVRLGYDWVNLKGQETATAPGGATAYGSKSNTQGGFNYGLGLETAIYQAWSLRGEYTYTSYNSFTTALGTKWSPSDNQFVLGLIYHFV